MDADLSELRRGEPGRFRLCGFCGAPLAPALPAAGGPQDGHDRLLRPQGLDHPRRAARPRVAARGDEPLLRGDARRARAPRRHGREVHRRRRHGRLRPAQAARGRRAAGGPRGRRRCSGGSAALNDELERVWGVRLANRTGVNTGEVVAGDPTTGQRLVTGDAVNVAARLEQAAPANEVLLGELTYRLVRDAVEVEAVEPLELKGKAERVPAYRLVSVAGDRRGLGPAPATRRSSAARRSSPTARAAFDEAVATRPCRLVTVVGDAGVGKSRLHEEFMRPVEAERGRPPRALPVLRRGHHLLAAASRPSARPPGSSDDDSRRTRWRSSRRSLGDGGDESRPSASPPRSASPTSRSRRGDLLGRPASCSRRSPATTPARRPLRRHPLGRADVPRPDRAPARRRSQDAPRPPALPRAATSCSRSGRTGPSARARRASCSSRSPTRTASAIVENLLGDAGVAQEVDGADRRGGRGQPALRRADALDARRRRAAAARGRPLDVASRALADLAVPPTIQALLAARLDRLERARSAPSSSRRR